MVVISGSGVIPDGKFTVGMRVTVLGAPSKAHMTLAFFEPILQKDWQSCFSDLKELSENILPCSISFGETDFFGPNNDIEVRHISTPPNDYELIAGFHNKWGIVQHGVKKGHPNLHVTVKDSDTIRQATEATCVEIFAKELGPHDPFCVLK